MDELHLWLLALIDIYYQDEKEKNFPKLGWALQLKCWKTNKGARCLKISENVSFNIASEASYDYKSSLKILNFDDFLNI